MNIIRRLETVFAARLGTATGLTCYAATDTAEMGSKPYIVVTASVEGRKGTQRQGQIECAICYSPTQGTDSNGTGASIFDVGDIVEDCIADSPASLTALNGTSYGTSFIYQTLRFAGAQVTADGDRSRRLEISGYWTGYQP